MARKRIWIEEGCIHCGWCHNLAPAVFLADGSGTRIAGAVRSDGITSDNRGERSPLRHGRLPADELAFMPFIADGCPAHVIHLDGWSGVGVADPGVAIGR
jgi:ferredoxin